MKIDIDGLNLEYIKKGTGENKILLLHGWGCNIETFNSITNFLSDFMGVYVIDLPGFGKSDEPSGLGSR